MAALNWLGGLALARAARKRGLLALLVAANLGVLCLFKYAGFAAESVNRLFPGLLPVLAPALPLGISFYIFTAIGYCADVAAARVEAARNPLRFFVFLAFFGHGPSGPIVRYGQQAPQLDPRAESRRVTTERFCYGIKRFLFGLAKKAILADQLALIYQRVTSVPAQTLPAPILVLGYTAFMLQLYFDFSGYSDMAVGIGCFFGLDLPENFDYPYLAQSIGEYWRRWHISLSSWFRDYVYIPLGGNRCSAKRHIFNLLVVWGLTGFWHGANFTFLAWGLYFGVLLIVEKYALSRVLDRMPHLLTHLYALFFIVIGWVLFRSDTLSYALDFLQVMFTPSMTVDPLVIEYLARFWPYILFGVVLSAPLYQRIAKTRVYTVLSYPLLAVLFVLCVMSLLAGSYNPFIYFRF